MSGNAQVEYSLLDAEGKPHRGTVLRSDLEKVFALLGQGYTLVELRELTEEETRSPAQKRRNPKALRISLQEMRDFTLHLSVMLGSGLGLMPSLTLVAECGTPTLSRLAGGLARELFLGHRLSEAMALSSSAFERTVVVMVRQGEESGRLVSVFRELSRRLGDRVNTRERLRSALLYPAAVVGVTGLMVAFMAFYMLPNFMPFVASFRGELPWPTALLMRVTELVVPLTIVSLAGLCSIPWLLSEVPAAAKIRNYLLYESPGLGRLNRCVELAELCEDLELMLSSGVHLLSALRQLQPGDPTLRELVAASGEQISRGLPWWQALESSGVVPPSMVAVVRVAEESGKFGKMLRFQARLLRQDAELARERLLQMVEPVLLFFLGAVVGFVLLACFLPIYQLAAQAL